MLKKSKVKWLAMAIVGTLFLITVTGVQAAQVSNWTDTVYTASSGDLVFDWDKSSQYDLSFAAPSVKSDKIASLGVYYEFLIPNFYDPLPMKTVEITINGNNGGAGGAGLARVIDVFGSDSEYGVPSPALPAPGQFVSGTSAPTEISELWHIFPNPDYETVTIWAPDAFELDSVQIATQSVPLPPALLMLGPALFGLVLFRRKVR